MNYNLDPQSIRYGQSRGVARQLHFHQISGEPKMVLFIHPHFFLYSLI